MSLTLVQPGMMSAALRQFLVNGNFHWWQVGTSVTGIANGSSTYGPDQWYAKNSLGTNGVLRIDQQTPVLAGSAFGCQVKISTAPTSGQTNGCELYQTLENLESLDLYNMSASFSIWVKALTNVNQIGVQFYYKTTEAKVDTAIGSEQLFTVNSSTFTQCFISGQALGTSQTTSGVIGVRIRITGVSSGNTYDINNGFIVEQAMMNLGANPAPFCTWGAGFEFIRCQRFYEVMGGEIANTPLGMGIALGATSVVGHISYSVTKRAVPTVTFSSQTKFRFNNASNNFVCSAISGGTAGKRVVAVSLTVSGASTNVGGDLDTVDATGQIFVDARI